MSMEERFKAAVNVIKGLPPKGTKKMKYFIDKKTKKKWQSISTGRHKIII